MTYSEMTQLYINKAKTYSVAQARNAIVDIDVTLNIFKDDTTYCTKLWCERDAMIERVHKAQAFNMTPAQVCEYYDSHPNITLKQLSIVTGKTVSYLKGLLLA